MKHYNCVDVLIIGAGLAGIYTALNLAPMNVSILAAAPLKDGSSSGWAQGGIAAAFSLDDSYAKHFEDTLKAGCYLNDPTIVDIMTKDAPRAIKSLEDYGVVFDKSSRGEYLQGREAAHSQNRIVKVGGDGVGRNIMSCLCNNAIKSDHISVYSPYIVFDLAICENGNAKGVYARTLGSEEHILFTADNIIFATGGIGYLYKDTTNPHQIRGEALGISVRHGLKTKDLEFVQFHPTALDIGKDPCPLATEALRGKGAFLVDDKNNRIMDKYIEKDLSPRDIVAREVQSRIKQGNKIFLDINSLSVNFEDEFPIVSSYCKDAGINIENGKIPIKPAHHYHMGGIHTDDYGMTSLPYLYAVGEVAGTGAHGANRLASNSLLEAIVFGYRAADFIKNTTVKPKSKIHNHPISVDRNYAKNNIGKIREIMTKEVGIIRSKSGLNEAKEKIFELNHNGENKAPFANYANASLAIIDSANNRKESIGSHFYTD